MQIRAATVDDAAAVALIHVEGWRWAYRGLLPGAYLDGLTVEDRAPRWRRLLSSGAQALVAVRGGEVAGFVSFGPDRQAPDSDSGEIYALYLLEHAAGTGTGRALFETGCDALRWQDYTSAVLWVLSSNARARRFYERAGWRADGGEKLEHLAGQLALELRYSAALAEITSCT